MPLKTPNGDFTKPLNKVYIADNLPALRALNESKLDGRTKFDGVDLIYLDPPFNSKADYNFIYGMDSATQGLTAAFTDTWTYEPKRFNNEVLNDPDTSEKVKKFLRRWRDIFGVRGRDGEELAYLGHMVPRLEAMHAVLKPTGSLYLHCDQSASHALKKALDLIFGARHFRNDIVWKSHSAKNNTKHKWGRVTDRILFYVKSDLATRNPIYAPLTDHYAASAYHYEDDVGRYTTAPLIATRGIGMHPKATFCGHTSDRWTNSLKVMRHWLDEGKIHMPEKDGGQPRRKVYLGDKPGAQVQELWTDISALQGCHSERTGYATQKPMELLSRIIKSSCNDNGVVLDPYCGCGSTIEACMDLTKEGNPRHFIGMELEGAATTVMRDRMRRRQGRDLELAYPKPESLSDFDQLAANKAYAYYEHYAVGLIPGCRAATKGVKEELGLPVKGPGDKGMDGLLPVTHKGKRKVIVISVKAGHKIPSGSVRDLSGVLHNRANKAIKGYLVTRKGEITANMREEAINAGFGNGLDKIRHISTYELWKMHRESLKRLSDQSNPKAALAQDRKAWAEFLDISEKLLEGVPDFNYTPEDWKMREHFPG